MANDGSDQLTRPRGVRINTDPETGTLHIRVDRGTPVDELVREILERTGAGAQVQDETVMTVGYPSPGAAAGDRDLS